jgi:hypothetical protein
VIACLGDAVLVDVALCLRRRRDAGAVRQRRGVDVVVVDDAVVDVGEQPRVVGLPHPLGLLPLESLLLSLAFDPGGKIRFDFLVRFLEKENKKHYFLIFV